MLIFEKKKVGLVTKTTYLVVKCIQIIEKNKLQTL